MTLEEKIRPHTKSWDCYNDEPLKYNHTRKVLKIVDEFAIDFADWIRVCKLKGRSYDFDNIKQLLQIYKKEKGL